MASGSSFGFQHGVVYKIVTVHKDRCSIEVEKGSIEPGAKVIAAKKSSQLFKTEQVDDAPGMFKIGGLLQPSDGSRLVWDFHPGEGLVIHNVSFRANTFAAFGADKFYQDIRRLYSTMNEGTSQIWLTERVHQGNNDIVYIKSQDEMCLRYNGNGKQLSLASQDAKDSHQHWRLDKSDQSKSSQAQVPSSKKCRLF